MSFYENDHTCIPSSMQMITEFHEKFERPIGTSDVTNARQMKFRIGLIAEEFQELRDAVQQKDEVELLDALGDILYVVYGFAVEMGWDLDEALRRIHASNMTKLWPDGKAHYNAYGKVIKPDSFEPPNLKDLIHESVKAALGALPNIIGESDEVERRADESD